MKSPRAPFLESIKVVPGRIKGTDVHPFNIPFVKDLDLSFTAPVTYLVGENGSGKSTLLEAIAVLSGYPVSGGGANDRSGGHGPEEESALSGALRATFRRRPKDGYFLRAEFLAHFASLLDARRNDPDFRGDPYARYGGRSLFTRSHGEAFLSVIEHRVGSGLFLFDEPESALSPQRQLALLVRMSELVAAGDTQFVIATHSPVLLTFPGATIISFDVCPPSRVRLEDTSHFRITSGILQNPELYWKHLVERESK